MEVMSSGEAPTPPHLTHTKHFIQLCASTECSSDTVNYILNSPMVSVFSNCTRWWCWRWQCCCCCCCCRWYHHTHHLGGVWPPPPIFSTHWAWLWWNKPWLLTLVDYHWAHCGSVWLDHSHSTGRIGLFTDNRTGWKIDKVILHDNNPLLKTHTYIIM